MKRTVVVTGGTKGLGRAISLAFGRADYSVLALFAADETAARELAQAMENEGLSIAVRRHDVCSDDRSIWNLPEIQQAESLTLINNACAAFSPMPMHQLGWPEFERSFLVAVKGAWACSQPLIRLMLKKQRGTIVNILTSAIEGPPPKGFAAYLTAKHALRGFTLALAAEYAARGLRVFSVSPGFMETPLTQQWDNRLRESIRANSTRLTVPAGAAARILELVQDEALPGSGENYSI